MSHGNFESDRSVSRTLARHALRSSNIANRIDYDPETPVWQPHGPPKPPPATFSRSFLERVFSKACFAVLFFAIALVPRFVACFVFIVSLLFSCPMADYR